MRDVARIDDILKRLKKIWKKYPDLRLGQLLNNCMSYGTLYYIEDEPLIETLEAVYKIKDKDTKKSV